MLVYLSFPMRKDYKTPGSRIQVMKCDICGKTIATTFLEKIKGTFVKDAKGKRHAVCFDCQKTLGQEGVKQKFS